MASFYDAWDRPAPKAGATVRLRPVSGDGTRYALKALAAECERVAAAQPGERDQTINAAAHAMGQLIGAEVLDEGTAVAALWDAARSTGQPEADIARALRRGGDRNAATGGIETGKRDPRIIPEETRPSGEAPPVTVLADQPLDPADPAADIRDRFPIIDWHELWTRESTEEWIIEPLLPARRLVALYSAPKVGKSLLMLELAVIVALGSEAFGTKLDRARRVLYVDFENDPEADIRERLKAMGHTPADLANLCYLSFPTMGYLDTEAGSAELLGAAEVYDCEVIIIDTISRTVGGDENENDTWLNFYRHTGVKLKKAKKALIRLDHSGKDEAKGQRGGSAKVGDVDAVWRMSKVTDTTFRLECEAQRFPILEKTLVLHRETTPRLRHRIEPRGRAALYEAKVNEYVTLLDGASAATDISNRDAQELLRTLGYRISNDPLAEALRRRKVTVMAFRDASGTPDEIAVLDLSPERLRNGDR